MHHDQLWPLKRPQCSEDSEGWFLGKQFVGVGFRGLTFAPLRVLRTQHAQTAKLRTLGTEPHLSLDLLHRL